MGRIKSEKRKYARYPAHEGTFVYCQERYGNVIDISKGGMAIDIVENTEPLPTRWETTFYCVTTDSKIEGIQVKLVREENTRSFGFGIKKQTVGVKIVNPTTLQQSGLRRHFRF